MTMAQRQEVFLFVGTRMAYLILKRWYDWQFGEEKMELPPGPLPRDKTTKRRNLDVRIPAFLCLGEGSADLTGAWMMYL